VFVAAVWPLEMRSISARLYALADEYPSLPLAVDEPAYVPEDAFVEGEYDVGLTS